MYELVGPTLVVNDGGDGIAEVREKASAEVSQSSGLLSSMMDTCRLLHIGELGKG